MTKIWMTTDGRPHDGVLAVFSTRERAERYRNLLIERYALGKNLSLHGKSLAHDIEAWRLGLGPGLEDRELDENPDFLRGAWIVKVDETCRMIACEFSTQARPSQPSATYRMGIHRVCQGHGATPHAALDAARKSMLVHLGRART